MLVIPAIDLQDGRCVRLFEGRPDTAREVSPDAVGQAIAFAEAGAERIHVVDLDGAFSGAPKNAALIRRIADAVDVPIQVGGGLRTAEAVEATLDAGAAFAILGTLAVDEPEAFAALCARFSGRIIAGVDGRGAHAATDGWVKESARTVVDVALSAEAGGATAVITTDISRDGTGRGVNVEDTRSLARSVSIPVIASGGVRDVDDVRALVRTEVFGVVVGRALYDGTLGLAEAMAAARA